MASAYPIALILVHGGASSGRMYSAVRDILQSSARYAAIYTPDLPGHGTSHDTGPFSFVSSTRVLHDLIQSIKSTNPSIRISIVGISLGGQAVLDLLIAHPFDVDAAIVSGVSIAPPNAEASWEIPRLPLGDSALMKVIMDDAQLLKPEELQKLQDCSLNFQLSPHNSTTSAAILVLRGEHDVAMANRDFDKLVNKMKEFSTSTYTHGQVLSGAWHNHSIDIPTTFATVINEWNEKVFSSGNI
jgi:pimeloyl-ACP methyl ester carboxylesterase